MEKVILHCDLNSFFASVEVRNNPELKGKPVAVCGSLEERHGIVLAKTQQASRMGVKTGEAIWQAQRKCRDLVIVPPHFDQYSDFSLAVRRIYYRFTDLVEPFGIDECWLDVTGSRRLFGNGYEIAEKIRETVKAETGLTISAGVSFNKVFAKLGSDIKKPDATTLITKENFKEQIWHLPASDMIGIGPATSKKLAKYGIRTIGGLASLDIDFCIRVFGKVGIDIWKNANGLGSDCVSKYNDQAPVKSIGRGNTFPCDLTTNEAVKNALMFLAEDVAYRLRKGRLLAKGVQIAVKTEELISSNYQAPLFLPTDTYSEITEKAFELFVKNYTWRKNVRALTVRAINLVSSDDAFQTNLFLSENKRERARTRELTMDNIRRRYGDSSVEAASLLHYRYHNPHFSPTFL